MRHYKAELEFETKASLGEGPLWHKAHQKLYFVDIDSYQVCSFDPSTGNHEAWEMHSYVSAIAIAKNNYLIAAVHDELIRLHIPTGNQETIVQFNFSDKYLRFNEGKCDNKGRFWLGTMHLEAIEGKGAFYRVNQDKQIKKVLSELSIPNGFCWSLDNKFLYHIDSLDQCVKRFEFHEESGNIDNPITILNFSDAEELPDGMCIDVEGMLWIAFWGGGKVSCYNPSNGNKLAQILVPAPHVTSCAFGGKNLDKLFITTARRGLSKEKLNQFPLSGSIFSCNVGVKGFDSHSFREN